MTEETVLVENVGPVAVLTINRPKALNALNRSTLGELDKIISECEVNTTVRAIVITGSGSRAFAAGADIGELQELDSAQAGFEHSKSSHELLFKMQGLSKPVIMAVNGYALGGGCELAMAGDIIIASESARFGQPEVNLGIIPGFGGTQRLPRLVGRVRALEMIFTGEHVTAQQALEMGLINRVVSAEQLMETALGIGNTIATKAPLAIALAKRAVYEGLEVGPRAGNDTEMAYFGLAVGTEDRREGTSAFLEKRNPEWRSK